jgi:hypothetical protein
VLKHLPDYGIFFIARILLKDFVKQGDSSPYAPVREDASFKLLCALSVSLDLGMYQYDVTQAFLNASFAEDVYAVSQEKESTARINISCFTSKSRKVYLYSSACFICSETLFCNLEPSPLKGFNP